MASRYTLVVTGLVGLAAGVLGGALGGNFHAPPAAPAAAARPDVAPLARLARALPERSMPTPVVIAAPAAVEPEPVNLPPPTPEGRAELLAAKVADHAERLAAHEAEPRDPSWAAGSELLYTEDLVQAESAGRFRLQRTDCRSNTCTVLLEWESYADAREALSLVVQTPKRRGCAENLFMPPPDDPAARYQATLILDCSNYEGPNAN